MNKTNKLSNLIDIYSYIQKHSFIRLLCSCILLTPIYIILYKIYIPKINAFGCFDDCFNFAGGYFLNNGKKLFSEIYFNHQPLMAYLSFIIQKFFNPVNIYGLLLIHRQSLLFFSFIFQILLFWRFGIIAYISMLIFEFTKFYVFGDRFLAESYVVYPLIYMCGLTIKVSLTHKISDIEYVFATVCAWFVIFMREPYVPLGLLLLFIIIRKKIFSIIGLSSLLIFFILTVFLFQFIPLHDYIDNVIVQNLSHSSLSKFSSGITIISESIKSLFYPLFIFNSGHWSQLRIVEIILSSIYVLSFILILKTKRYTVVLLILTISLLLANIRPTDPGIQYYEAFHMIIWYGLFIFSTVYLFYEITSLLNKKKFFYIILIPVTLYILFSPQSIIFQKTDSHTEFITNYGHYIGIGETIKALSQRNQTMFIDGNEELLYWQTKLSSSYKYSFYYPAKANSKYFIARNQMFLENPPDFYFDFCTPLTVNNPSFPPEVIHLYQQLYEYGKPSCLYIKKALLPIISSDQWLKAKEFGYSLPE